MSRQIPPRNSFLGILDRMCDGDAELREEILREWGGYFGIVNYLNRPTRRDLVRLQILKRFLEIKHDERLKRGIINIGKFGIFLTRDKQSQERHLKSVVDDYELGREFERHFALGELDKRFCISVEPAINYFNQEGMWRMTLADMTLKDPHIARISFNLHREQGRVVASIVELHGTEGRKNELDAFLHRYRQPWPIFLMQAFQYAAKKANVATIRGINGTTQPFYHRTGFISGKTGRMTASGEKSYDLYRKTFENLQFRPNAGNTFYEMSMSSHTQREKRAARFASAFIPLEKPIPRVTLPRRKTKERRRWHRP